MYVLIAEERSMVAGGRYGRGPDLVAGVEMMFGLIGGVGTAMYIAEASPIVPFSIPGLVAGAAITVSVSLIADSLRRDPATALIVLCAMLDSGYSDNSYDVYYY